MTHTFSRLGKVLVSPLAATLLISFSQVGICAASISPTTVQRAEQSPAKKERVKRAPKAHKKVVKKVVPRSAAAEAAAPSAMEAPVGLVLKQSQAVATEMPQPTPAAASEYVPRVNPYLVQQQPSAPSPAPAYAANAGETTGSSGFKFSMPQIPLFEQSILPKVKTVYPTGEKPLVVVTFKCPTELIGIDTPSTLILHKVVNGGMDVINKTNLLSFNMQQVCQ